MSVLIQVMACRLLGEKPLPVAMLPKMSDAKCIHHLGHIGFTLGGINKSVKSYRNNMVISFVT